MYRKKQPSTALSDLSKAFTRNRGKWLTANKLGKIIDKDPGYTRLLVTRLVVEGSMPIASKTSLGFKYGATEQELRDTLHSLSSRIGKITHRYSALKRTYKDGK